MNLGHLSTKFRLEGCYTTGGIMVVFLKEKHMLCILSMHNISMMLGLYRSCTVTAIMIKMKIRIINSVSSNDWFDQ